MKRKHPLRASLRGCRGVAEPDRLPLRRRAAQGMPEGAAGRTPPTTCAPRATMRSRRGRRCAAATGTRPASRSPRIPSKGWPARPAGIAVPLRRAPPPGRSRISSPAAGRGSGLRARRANPSPVCRNRGTGRGSSPHGGTLWPPRCRPVCPASS